MAGAYGPVRMKSTPAHSEGSPGVMVAYIPSGEACLRLVNSRRRPCLLSELNRVIFDNGRIDRPVFSYQD